MSHVDKIIEEIIEDPEGGFKTPTEEDDKTLDWAEQVVLAQQMDAERERLEREKEEAALKAGEPPVNQQVNTADNPEDKRPPLQRQSISNSQASTRTVTPLALKLKTQLTRWSAIESLAERIHRVKIIKQSISDLEAWEKLLNNYWSQFSNAHEKLCEETAEEFISSKYIQEDMHGQLITIHASAVESIELARAKINAAFPPVNSSIPSSNQPPSLSNIQIPKFSGEYAEWRPFADFFLSMVGNVDHISPVVKLCRLREALTGPAADLIKNISPTKENYSVAWSKLVSRYENPRWIKNSLFSRLSKLKPLTEKSAQGLLSLISTFSEVLDSLKALGEPTEYWDSMVSFRLRELIDVETREAWEVEIGDSTESPPLHQFIQFIQARARALEHSQADKGQSKKNAAALGIYHGATPPDPPKQRDPLECVCCKGDHHLGPACSAFIRLNPKARRQLVQSKKRCFNCLGPHSAGDCKSHFRCLKCKGKHHTLIHEGAPGQQGKSTPSGNGSSSSTATVSTSAGDKPKSNLSTNRAVKEACNGNITAAASIKPASIVKVTKESSEISSSSTTTATSSITPTVKAAGEVAYHRESTNLQVHHQANEATVLHGSGGSSSSVVLLATARVQAIAAHGTAKLPARALIDTGSEITCISEALAQRLRLNRTSASIKILGIGGKTFTSSRGTAELHLQSNHEPEQIVRVNAHILPRLTAQLPSKGCESSTINITKGLKLADNDFLKSRHIDIIIGADNYAKIIGNGIKKASDGKIVAQLTIFGWVIYGPVSCINDGTRKSLTAVRETSADQLLDLMRRFWCQEEANNNRHPDKLLNQEELECEEFFKKTYQRDSTGRYIVRLPLKSSALALGDSRPKALRLLYQTERKLSTNPVFEQLYTEFLKDYLEKGHMHQVRATEELSTTSPVFYLPHHGVLREESITTKLRVVFNGSSKTSTGISLNDILHPGHNLQLDGSDVLTWFRLHRLVFGTDISQMFRQIQLHQSDQDLQRILWFDENRQPISFRLSTVTYGLNCAPFLALRVLNQLKEDEGENYPAAISSMSKGRYMDDIFGGAETAEDLKKIIKDLQGLCTAGGFPLHKWVSNEPRVLQELELTSGDSSSIKELEESIIKVLGLGWHPSSDTFKYKARKYTKPASTKREILSEIAQIFDPLGLIAPVVIRAKIFIQELWLLKVNWDDQLPIEFVKRWKEFRESFGQLDTLSIPRWFNSSSSNSSIQLHGFGDASNLAMAAAVYLRVENPGKETSITLIKAKTKVAPLKKMVIPRLELTAALILTELTAHIQEVLNYQHIQVFLWTDSSVALAWIKGHPSRWKEFVQNRVIKIQEAIPKATWRHISGKDNPADCASRGLSPIQLAEHKLWLNGPEWLKLSPNNWPTSSMENPAEVALEERPQTLQSYPVQQHLDDDLLDRYSSLSKVLRISSRIFRYFRRLRGQANPEDRVITAEELETSRKYWIKKTQHQHFGEVIQRLRSGHPLKNHHPLSRLVPYLDAEGILRLGGRLKNSLLDPEEINPAILPRSSRFTWLVLDEAHQRTFHGGNQLTLAYTRQKYWIIGGRNPVRSFTRKCVICARHRATRARQLMGQLPTPRVTPSRAFLYTGVDFAGPIIVLKWKNTTRANAAPGTFKAYIAVFICMATSAVHLELVADLSTEGFIGAFKRFISRRGLCSTLYSDCGRNFVGAEKELAQLFDQASEQYQEMAAIIAADGTEWKFNPPQSPHFGGLWEAAVKSTKYHLKRITNNTRMTFDQLTTLLTQIEAILNSRPLCPLSEDPEDVSALTPGHFLIGGPPTLIPEPSLEDLPVQHLTRWQIISEKTRKFWDWWTKEYLQRYQSISKWKQAHNDIKVGSLVLITDNAMIPGKWPLGRVIKLHYGPDGHSRVADLYLAKYSFIKKRETSRAIHQLVPLPINPVEVELADNQRRMSDNYQSSDYQASDSEAESEASAS